MPCILPIEMFSNKPAKLFSNKPAILVPGIVQACYPTSQYSETSLLLYLEMVSNKPAILPEIVQ